MIPSGMAGEPKGVRLKQRDFERREKSRALEMLAKAEDFSRGEK